MLKGKAKGEAKGKGKTSLPHLALEPQHGQHAQRLGQQQKMSSRMRRRRTRPARGRVMPRITFNMIITNIDITVNQIRNLGIPTGGH